MLLLRNDLLFARTAITNTVKSESNCCCNALLLAGCVHLARLGAMYTFTIISMNIIFQVQRMLGDAGLESHFLDSLYSPTALEVGGDAHYLKANLIAAFAAEPGDLRYTT
jgi:hypothetical protein